MQYRGTGENCASNNSQSMQLVTDKSGITLTTHREGMRRDRHTGHKDQERERDFVATSSPFLQPNTFFTLCALIRKGAA